GFDPNARNRRLASWFAPHVRRELELIASRLDDLRGRDAELAGVLTACLSAILYKVSSRTSDTDGTWVDRNVPRGAAARHFAQRVELLSAGLADLARAPGPMPEVVERDARRLAEVVPDGSAAGVITSPPYAGTYDYAEHQRLRFDFLALRHRELDAGEIGSRRSFEADPDAGAAWRAALADALDAIARALAPGRAAAPVALPRPLPIPVEFVAAGTPPPEGARRERADVVAGIELTDEAARRRAEWAVIRRMNKSFEGPVDALINWRFSMRITRLLAQRSLALTPNHVTITAILVGLCASLLASRGGYASFAIAGVLLEVNSILDSCDGELA